MYGKICSCLDSNDVFLIKNVRGLIVLKLYFVHHTIPFDSYMGFYNQIAQEKL